MKEARELLQDHDEVWASRLKEAVHRGEHWALKLFAEYRFSKPAQTTDITIGEVLKPDWIEDL